jgi:hypothetical protein
VLLDRAAFSRAALQIFSKVERGELRGSICATTVTTIFYLTTKYSMPIELLLTCKNSSIFLPLQP